MITIIIGHRGVGKTTFLKRVQNYHQARNIDCNTIDLDAFIEDGEKQSIRKIFEFKGEPYFRELEKKYFTDLMTGKNETITFISVGGGFDTTLIPPTVRVVWLQRVSDRTGRIFFDRPSLDAHLSPLEEFFERANVRKVRFQKAAWEEYYLPEGHFLPSMTEQNIVLGEIKDNRGILTLLPHNFDSDDRWHFFIRTRLRWGIDYFEIRDDLLSLEQMRKALQTIPKEKLLWARRVPSAPSLFDENEVAVVDFDESLVTDLSDEFQGERVISFHQRMEGETIQEILKRSKTFEDRGFHIKMAIEIRDFTELGVGHEWQMAQPRARSFLPRSAYGQWMWYRLWKSTKQKINFFREGEGSSLDQPTLFEWMERRNKGEKFAALLGDPVSHSFTPHHQSEFFQEFKMPVFAIKVDRQEFETAMKFLASIGLVAAAVTSPLKPLAFNFVTSRTAPASECESVNTIVRDHHFLWFGHNTDLEGLHALLDKAEKLGTGVFSNNTAVWGGGGTLALLKRFLPKSHYFSVQTGKSRNHEMILDWSPKVVVWASGSLQPVGGSAPPEFWKPNWIIDLNYREDSGGREYAKKMGAQYLSGESMFYEQAIYQREFWRPFLQAFADV